jgi:hypothetical protein
MNTTSWRDRQISSFKLDQKNFVILQQEKIMLDFMESCGQTTWKWMGDSNTFAKFCHSVHDFSDKDYQGIIIFGSIFFGKPTSYICQTIKDHITNVKHVYCAVNRYLISEHDMTFELPDSIEASMDCIIKHCHPNFKRLHTFAEADGNHMIAAHPLDCYGLCK